MERTDCYDLDSMQAVDIRTVDKTSLVDLNTVKIDDTQPIPERIHSFLQQIKNPYCFRIGDIAVKVNTKKTGRHFSRILRSCCEHHKM